MDHIVDFYFEFLEKSVIASYFSGFGLATGSNHGFLTKSRSGSVYSESL